MTPHNRVAGISLDVLRGIQGVGAAAMIPASVSSLLGLSIRAVSKDEQPRQLGILSRAFPPGSSRSIAFATFSAGAPVGSAFSTVLSSVLTQLTR